VIDYDPLSPEVKQDPQKYFSVLREECPVHHHVLDDVDVEKMNRNPWIAEPVGEFWSVFRYEDSIRIAQDAKRFSSREGPGGPERLRAMTEEGMLIFADDPAHRWQRSIANRAFTPRRVAELEPDIQRVADDVIDSLHPRGECDLFTEFAAPMTIRVIAKIVGGVDDSRIDDFFRWGNDTMGAFGSDDDFAERSFASAMEFHAYFSEILDARRTALAQGDPVPDDILNALIVAEAEGRKLSDVELFMGAQQLMTAGFETTTTALANGIWLLDQHPEQRALVENDPALIPELVEETLRFASPVEGLYRTTNEDVEIHGTRIPKGSRVRFVLSAANRDSRQFERADEFDLMRDPVDLRKHVAFGHGIHTCLGAALARIEMKVAFETLLRRLPNLHVDPDKTPTRNPFLLVSGFNYLPVLWDRPETAPGM